MNVTEKSTTARLVRRAARGNADAYGTLITLHKEYLYRMAYLHSGNEDSALEIVQETVLKGFASIKTLRSPELFKTWITSILIHTASDYQRSHPGCADISEHEPIRTESGISQEEKMDLYEAVRKLPDVYRTVIVLKYFDGLKQQEIAQIMGIPRGSVSAYLTRARKELKHSLKEGYLNE